MTRLRQMMLDELQRFNYAQSTVIAYLHAVKDFAAYYHKAPDKLGLREINGYQLHLLRDRKLAPRTVQVRIAGVRFFFVRTLKRNYPPSDFRYPKMPRRLPVVLSQDEVRSMIDAATSLVHRTLLMILYSTGMRRAELSRLTVGDINSQRMVIHIRQGKGSKDRDVPLSAKLLETIREYWRWKKPRAYLFPGEAKRGSNGEHISAKAIYLACKGAARRAGIQKPVGPHTLRQYAEFRTMPSRFLVLATAPPRRSSPAVASTRELGIVSHPALQAFKELHQLIGGTIPSNGLAIRQ